MLTGKTVPVRKILKKHSFWSKIYRVVYHSVNMGVVEIYIGNFLENEQLFRNFEQLVDRASGGAW